MDIHKVRTEYMEYNKKLY